MTQPTDLAYLDERSYARKKQRAMDQPEAITSRSTVVVEDETGIETTYIVVTVRVLTPTGAAHLSFIEWQDGQTDEAFKVVLPSKVVSKVANHIDATNARNRSRVSRRNSNPNAFGNLQRPALDVDNPQHPFTVIGGGEEEQIS
jgi:hypothetical protein